MDTMLLALTLSGGAGLWTLGQKGELIIPDGDDLISEIGFPAFHYASIQDNGLLVSYTDDSCIDGLKVQGCENGTNILGILDTAGQEEFSDVVMGSIDGQLVIQYTADDDPDHFDGGYVRCGESDSIIGSELDAGFQQGAVFQLHKGTSWDVAARVQETGFTYQKIEQLKAHTTLTCAAYSGGELVAETTIAVRNADRLKSNPSSVTGALGYRGSWVE